MLSGVGHLLKISSVHKTCSDILRVSLSTRLWDYSQGIYDFLMFASSSSFENVQYTTRLGGCPWSEGLAALNILSMPNHLTVLVFFNSQGSMRIWVRSCTIAEPSGAKHDHLSELLGALGCPDTVSAASELAPMRKFRPIVYMSTHEAPFNSSPNAFHCPYFLHLIVLRSLLRLETSGHGRLYILVRFGGT